MKISLEQINNLLERELSQKEVEDAFSLHAFEIDEVIEDNGQVVFDVDVLPNRSSDALSVLGLARELSAILDIPMKEDLLQEDFESILSSLKEKENPELLQVERKDKEYASAYFSAYIKGVKVGESPKWLKDFLASQGQKSINNLVDATNYVLFFLGQPTHIFDADALKKDAESGAHRLAVRKAKEKEQFRTLDKQEFELSDRIRVIEDAVSGEPIAIAGVKGGESSGVSEQTADIVLESARFHPTLTRKVAQELSLRTDASKRFENDIPERLPVFGLKLLIDTVLELAGGELKATAVSYEPFAESPQLRLDMAKIQKLIGVDITKEQAGGYLKHLRFDVSGDVVKPPFWRTDIKIWQDLAEEIARLYGLSKIKPTALPQKTKDRKILPSFCHAELLRDELLADGFVEITNSTLQDKGELELANSLASDKNFFRDDLSYGMLKALDKNERNAPLFGIYDAIKLFEIGTVYKDTQEFASVCIGVRPLAKKKREARAQAILEELRAKLQEKFAVELPEAKGEVLEFPLSVLSAVACDKYPEPPSLENIQYKAFSQFPFVLRDIAVWVPEDEPADALATLIKENGGELLRRADLFDEFKKDARVSYAYHLVFQSDERTLTDEDVNKVMSKIESAIDAKGWEIR